MERPNLAKQLKAETFREYYYLKEELISFCRKEGLQVTGSKEMLSDMIYQYLETGEKKRLKKKTNKAQNEILALDAQIVEPVIFGEDKRKFFKKHLGETFKFSVVFQKWMKANVGKTYQEAIDAYPEVISNKPDKIDKQFEYNTYIRDFFLDNKDKTLKQAIQCWKNKKQKSGHNQYEVEDLKILKER